MTPLESEPSPGLGLADLGETSVLSVADDAALLAVAGECVEDMLGFPLAAGPEGSLTVETDAGTLYVAAFGSFVLTLELCLGPGFPESSELLAFLNGQNAGLSFCRVSIVEDQLWVSANVDGNPFLPVHLARVLGHLFEVAASVGRGAMALDAPNGR